MVIFFFSYVHVCILYIYHLAICFTKYLPMQMSMNMLKHVVSTVLMDHLKVKYHIMEATFSILQLFDHVADTTEDCATVVAMNLCHKFFDKSFKVLIK